MKVSIVAPVLNEYECINEFIKRVQRTIKKTKYKNIDLILIDDGSETKFLDLLVESSKQYSNIKIISFEKNYGHQMAILAGYEYSHTKYDLTISIDSDLQDPPELIEDLLNIYEKNNVNIVYTIRNKNDKRSRLKYFLSNIFYSILFISNKNQSLKFAGDFRLVDRSAMEFINENRSKIYFIRSFLFMNKTLKFTTLNFQRDQRFAGVPKYTFFKLYQLAISGLLPYLNKYILTNIIFLAFLSLVKLFFKSNLFNYLILILLICLLIIVLTKLTMLPRLNNDYKIKKIYS